mmetsp:Transcript_65739/g.148337  ORF Transcript_65739/g.148337 Transcript_65739/m.148337 type:complete len:503 (+) Transcript_65739:49-1557(+)
MAVTRSARKARSSRLSASEELARARSRSRSKSPSKRASKKSADAAEGSNWVEGGVGCGLIFVTPVIVHVVSWLTSEQALRAGVDPKLGLSGLLSQASTVGLSGLLSQVKDVVLASIVAPTWPAVQFLLVFNAVALVLEQGLPGKVETGPETLTGHVPKYVNNALSHCFVFTLLFYALSDMSPISGFDGLYSFGCFFDIFPAMMTSLSLFGFALCFFLYYKGLNFPSTEDCGSSGSFLKDFTWGTELYPRVFGIDIKRFINCRFSMTYWMLAGASFTYSSYKRHGQVDWGLALGSLSQFLYLVKFFEWEMGYMRSIDIIVDRAGWEIQWGCLCWVPAVYTFHSRFLVLHPSGLSAAEAGAIFAVGFSGVLLNYWADTQRKTFRESEGDCLIWGQRPKYVKATYTVTDPETGLVEERESLLLASGFWGVARHFHYVFELTAAWSWCLLANPSKNGAAPLLYAVFLTILLLHRAKRDEKKCSLKYGKHYAKYSKLVPYLVIPGIY